jgi:hypothetical protein
MQVDLCANVNTRVCFRATRRLTVSNFTILLPSALPASLSSLSAAAWHRDPEGDGPRASCAHTCTGHGEPRDSAIRDVSATAHVGRRDVLQGHECKGTRREVGTRWKTLRDSAT